MIFAIALLITGSGGAAAVLGTAGLIHFLKNKKKRGIDEETFIEDSEEGTPEEMENVSGVFFNEAVGMATPSPDEDKKFSSLMGGAFDESNNAMGEFENESEHFKFEADEFSHAATDTADELKKMATEIRDLKLRLASTSQNLLKTEEFLSEKKRILEVVMDELKTTSDELVRSKKEYGESLKKLQEKLSEEKMSDENEIIIKNKEIELLRNENKKLSTRNISLIKSVEKCEQDLEIAETAITVYQSKIKNLLEKLSKASEDGKPDENQNTEKQGCPSPAQNMRFFNI